MSISSALSTREAPVSTSFLFAIKDLFIPPRLDSIHFLQERRQASGERGHVAEKTNKYIYTGTSVPPRGNNVPLMCIA